MERYVISIAIPVRDAGERLERTLASIAASTDVPLERVQVVVVDDGSTDDAVEHAEGVRYPFELTVHRGAWGSQSAATNAAIDRCRAPLVLLSAQDIRFEPTMLRAHLDAHERTSGVAVLGDLPYAPEADTGPFTFYLVNGGFQFAYFLIRDPRHVPPNFFYAPNVSVPREALERVGGFDERFPYGLQDTDLGIRLDAAGVRLVHEPRAVGLHDHPTTLDAFRARMARVAPLRLEIEAKHPHHEPCTPSWDLVVSACLAYDPLRRELDLREVDRLEPAVAARPAFRELWRRQLAGTLPVAALSDEDRTTLRLTDRLFAAYGRVLQAEWSGAYLDAAIERDGRDRVNGILRARLARLQAPRPAYRVVEHALAERGLAPAGLAAPIGRSLRVIHGVADRESALAVLDRFLPPSAGAVDQELVLLVEPGALEPDTIAALARTATVIEAAPRLGLARAAEAHDAELVIVTDASWTIDEQRTVELGERLLAKLGAVGALGGTVGEAPRAPVPLDAPPPECVLVRRAAACALASTEPASDDEPWTMTLGRAIRATGGLVLHVPDVVARRRPEAATPRPLSPAVPG